MNDVHQMEDYISDPEDPPRNTNRDKKKERKGEERGLHAMKGKKALSY